MKWVNQQRGWEEVPWTKMMLLPLRALCNTRHTPFIQSALVTRWSTFLSGKTFGQSPALAASSFILGSNRHGPETFHLVPKFRIRSLSLQQQHDMRIHTTAWSSYSKIFLSRHSTRALYQTAGFDPPLSVTDMDVDPMRPCIGLDPSIWNTGWTGKPITRSRWGSSRQIRCYEMDHKKSGDSRNIRGVQHDSELMHLIQLGG